MDAIDCSTDPDDAAEAIASTDARRTEEQAEVAEELARQRDHFGPPGNHVNPPARDVQKALFSVDSQRIPGENKA